MGISCTSHGELLLTVYQALENATVNELVEIDDTYLDRLTYRRQIMSEYSNIVLAASPRIKPAVDELYTWMCTVYLPTRFPTIFALSRPQNANGVLMLTNKVTSETLPTVPYPDPVDSLRTLGSHIDLDMLFLLPSESSSYANPGPSPSTPTQQAYTLEGFITCFPNGFDTSQKLSLTLAAIHNPVPRYSEKLEKSMDRFFARIPVGTFVKRANWTVTTNSELFAPSGNHFYAGEEKGASATMSAREGAEAEAEGAKEKSGVEFEQEDVGVNGEKAWVRCEAQMLHRLPDTKALVFSFKTYMYTLAQIKEEGDDVAEMLAQAIEGMERGSVPEIYTYKRGVAWGRSAVRFLRGK